ncbi:hypothetical protein DLAC_02158 [Tieghemostelium lacteum]|uniref:Lipoprotein n=1 Tax=Tieghemostelium lacteum TaxID=361077 RepID=A0A152A481_TIELA|nr:hypothetical protein DLAC_02158 [Tieghemostelium lacteum]|eukprot:KYR01063.1 hypothetical protein DLAC_02158 [Tieghemostelium lacteum]
MKLYLTLFALFITLVSCQTQIQTGYWDRNLNSPCGQLVHANVSYSYNDGGYTVTSSYGSMLLQNLTFDYSNEFFTAQGALYSLTNGQFLGFTDVKGFTSSTYYFQAAYAPSTEYNYPGGTDYYTFTQAPCTPDLNPHQTVHKGL